MNRSLALWMVLLASILLGGIAAGQTTSSSSASAVSSGEPLQVSVGTFCVERRARLAFEIVRDTPCVCLCSPIQVLDVALLNSKGSEILRECYDTPIDAAEWLFRISLSEAGDATLLPDGTYTVRIQTNIGQFSAALEIVPLDRMAHLGRFSSSASVCGIALRVYRLLTEEDHGTTVELRQGDRLMVALAGNATTGFQWDNTLLYEYAVLRETREPEYRAKPNPQTMVGYGGAFLFRYVAIAPGPQSFHFVYHRPWESVQPQQVFEFDAEVH